MFVYHDRYDLRLGPHVFPSRKYRLLHDRLIGDGIVKPETFVAPEPATDDDILRVHTADWVRKLKIGALTPEEIQRLEIPWSPETMNAFWLATGGTILAARIALESGIGFNLSGGFHHAFADHGEGFCAVNDIAVAIRRLQRDGAIRRAMVVDCDVHHGNGTAGIFAGDQSVFTLSIHQLYNYPGHKPLSSMDIHLPDGTDDAEYLRRLGNGYRAALATFQAELIVFVAGADPFREDQLGGLALTFEGLEARDRLVLREAKERKIPVAIVLAGGYARDVEDTVTIHAKTAEVAKSLRS